VLGRIGTPEALEALRHALADGETGVRATAVDAIAHFGTPDARALLEVALRDRDDEVRSIAATALRQLRR
jgi:HEAT repeat protein